MSPTQDGDNPEEDVLRNGEKKNRMKTGSEPRVKPHLNIPSGLIN